MAWERLRLLFNGLLLLGGLPVASLAYLSVGLLRGAGLETGFFMSSRVGVIAGCAAFALAANLLYLLGPAVEVYVVSFTRVPFGRGGRIAIFVLGLLVFLAIEAVVASVLLDIPLVLM